MAPSDRLQPASASSGLVARQHMTNGNSNSNNIKPRRPKSYAAASATEDDDVDGVLVQPPLRSLPSAALPTETGRHQSSKQHRPTAAGSRHRSPLAEAKADAERLIHNQSHVQVQRDDHDEQDQQDDDDSAAETARWGWLLLAATWLVFVVAIGSCLDLWAWAFAAAELPEAQQLPVRGYYPALAVLTGVMSWVWVTVAWMGMKYFKHAKLAG